MFAIFFVKIHLSWYLNIKANFFKTNTCYIKFSKLEAHISSQVKSSLFKQGGPFSTKLLSIGALRNSSNS